MNSTTHQPLHCEGYKTLLAAVKRDLERHSTHDYQAKLDWIIDRAHHYAEKTNLTPEAILDAWEKKRSYWYMNYYQEANQPKIESDKVKIFKTITDLKNSIQDKGFRCPACKGISTDAQECNAETKRPDGSTCDWKVYGLLNINSITIFLTEENRLHKIFPPIAWEK